MALRLGMPDLGWQLGLVAAAAALGVLAGVDPSLAVLTALGLAFIALLMTNLTVGLCMFAFISFLEVLPAGSGLSVTKVAGLLLAVSWVATVAVRDQANRQFFSAHPLATYALTVFLAWAALSIVWAESPGAAATATSRFGLNFLLLPIVYTAVRERRHVVWVTVAFVAGAAACSL